MCFYQFIVFIITVSLISQITVNQIIKLHNLIVFTQYMSIVKRIIMGVCQINKYIHLHQDNDDDKEVNLLLVFRLSSTRHQFDYTYRPNKDMVSINL